MRMATIVITLIAAVGCADSAPCDNTGGAGGFGGEGGAGGAPGDPRGELARCDFELRNGGIITTYERIEGTPGDVVFATRCYFHRFENDVQTYSGDVCGTSKYTIEESGNTLHTDDGGDLSGLPGIGCTELFTYETGYTEVGFEEVWIRFED